MNIGTIQTPAFIAVLLLVSTVAITVTAMAMSKLPLGVSDKDGDTLEGPACDLPPAIEIEGRENKAVPAKAPSLDKKVTKNYKTATFAMG